MRLSIRRARPSDIGVLFKLSMDFLKESKPSYPVLDEEEVENKMLSIMARKDDPNWLHLVAFDGKKPAGFFIGYVTEHDYGKPSKAGVCQEMYIDPRKRNGQVARALMREMYRWGKGRGVESFECVGSYGEDGTARMWERHGFSLHLAYGHLSMEEAARYFEKKDQEEK